MQATVFKGPGGTEYRQVGCGPAGRVGIANLGNNRFRIRIEPGVTSVNQVGESLGDGWNRPAEGNSRFSIVVNSESKADQAVETALRAVGAEEPKHSKGELPPASLAAAYAKAKLIELEARNLADMLETLRG
jgi:hypothetical protein